MAILLCGAIYIQPFFRLVPTASGVGPHSRCGSVVFSDVKYLYTSQVLEVQRRPVGMGFRRLTCSWKSSTARWWTGISEWIVFSRVSIITGIAIVLRHLISIVYGPFFPLSSLIPHFFPSSPYATATASTVIHCYRYHWFYYDFCRVESVHSKCFMFF